MVGSAAADLAIDAASDGHAPGPIPAMRSWHPAAAGAAPACALAQARATTSRAAAVTGIEENRPDQQFADIGEDRRLAGTAGLRFAAAEPHMRSGAPGGSDFGAAFLAHEIGEPARQFPLARRRESRIEHLRHHEAEHPVAEEFEPLIGLAAAARADVRADMGQRPQREITIGETVPEPALELLERGRLPATFNESVGTVGSTAPSTATSRIPKQVRLPGPRRRSLRPCRRNSANGT